VKLRCSRTIALVSFLVSLGLLFAAYPWSVSLRNSTNKVGITLSAYLFVAGAIGITTFALACWIPEQPRISARRNGVIFGSVLFAVLFGASVLFGPVGFEFPGTRVRWIFFSEWQFATFDGYVALPLSIVDAALASWMCRWKGMKSTNPGTMHGPTG
jgi:hypothetical protein